MSTKSVIKSIFPNLVPIHKIGDLSCPDCAILMVPYSCENVVVDKCPDCKGIWFDQKELGIFRESLAQFPLEKIKIAIRPPEPTAHVISTCPRCKDILYEVNYSYNTKVKISRCERCHGIWLPLHQTIKLIELVQISQAIAPHVQGMAEGFREIEKTRVRDEKLKRASRQLNKRIPTWRAYIYYYYSILMPLYDDNPRTITPLVTIGLVLVNVFVFILLLKSETPMSELYKNYAMIPRNIMQLESLETLIYSMFMHAGFFHLFGNMFFLWTFGDNVEEMVGRTKFFLFYFLCGLAASAVQIISNTDSSVPILGASGAISGILGAYIVLFPHVTIKTLVLGAIIDLPTWIYIGFWFGLNLLWGLMYFGSHASGVAWWAHVGGFMAGLVLAWLAKAFGFIERRVPQRFS